MKLCKDCLYCVIDTEIDVLWRCACPESNRENPVTGKSHPMLTVAVARSHSNLCGKEGKWYKP